MVEHSKANKKKFDLKRVFAKDELKLTQQTFIFFSLGNSLNQPDQTVWNMAEQKIKFGTWRNRRLSLEYGGTED